MYQNVRTKRRSHDEPPRKQQKPLPLSPIVVAKLRVSLGKPTTRLVQCLIDTGASDTIVFNGHCGKLRIKNKKIFKVGKRLLALFQRRARVKCNLPCLNFMTRAL